MPTEIDPTHSIPSHKSRKVRFQKLRVFIALMLRGMTAQFGESVGGYFWAFAEPVGGILLLSVVFSFALVQPPIGNSFMLFYATGVIPFFMYKSISDSVANSIRLNKGLLTYPVVSTLDAIFARTALEVLTYFVITSVLLPVIIFHDNADFHFSPINVILSMLMAISLGIGVGTINCVLFGFFPTFRNIWSILNRPLFLLSGLMFTFDTIPLSVRDYLWYNTILQIIGQMRMGLFGSYDGSYISKTYVFSVSMILFLLGAFFLRINESKLLEK